MAFVKGLFTLLVMKLTTLQKYYCVHYHFLFSYLICWTQDLTVYIQHWPSLRKFHTWAREAAGVIQRVLKTTPITIPLEKLDTWTSVMLQSVEWENHGSWELLQKAVDYFRQKTPWHGKYLTSSRKQILKNTVQVLIMPQSFVGTKLILAGKKAHIGAQKSTA